MINSKRKYSSKLKSFAQSNRKFQTFGETKLWSQLRGRRFLDYKFRRQFPFKNFILDFYCEDLKLCIEVDGFSHEGERFEKDLLKDASLKNNSIKVLRFTEFEVVNKIDDVMQTLENFVRGYLD
jgi:very-short-patch-repair endonuclease